ncbi:MAG: hypothetical protein G01um101438_780 [Parcubacteria group bacterium Gr01-1014_38]|nr:MAG: hypothetical protein G01um101438_780 [Parcubacteria group bacterium Gr01-1014_38]
MLRVGLDAWLHDRVVETVAAQASGYAAYTNLGGHHSICLTGSFPEVSPDVILCDPESFLVDHVVQVETEGSIDPSAARQWVNIARAVHGRGQFWILVPPFAVSTAARLCQQYGIPAKIGTWSADSRGVLVSWPAPLHAAPVRRP